MAYTTQTKIENMFGITMTAAQAAATTDIIAAVKAWIDRYCGKSFEAASESRYYDGNGHENLLIDSFVGNPTEVLLLNYDGTTEKTLTLGPTGDYILQPYNPAITGGAAEYNTLRMTGYSTYHCWPKRTKAVKVTASFGASSSVPADIQFAATKIAGLMVQDAGEGIINSIRLGDYSATFEKLDEQTGALGVNNILDQYRDIDI